VKPPHVLLLMTHFPDPRNRNRYAFYDTDRCRREVGIFVFMAREWGRQRKIRTLEAEDRICKDATMHRGTIARRNATLYHVIHSSFEIITRILIAASARPVSVRLLWESGILSIIPSQMSLLCYITIPYDLLRQICKWCRHDVSQSAVAG
jgi:hypothetical protein